MARTLTSDTRSVEIDDGWDCEFRERPSSGFEEAFWKHAGIVYRQPYEPKTPKLQTERPLRLRETRS